MKCEAITDPGDRLFRRASGPCQFEATRGRFCGIHDPAIRIPKLQKREQRLLQQLEDTRRQIHELTNL